MRHGESLEFIQNKIFFVITLFWFHVGLLLYSFNAFICLRNLFSFFRCGHCKQLAPVLDKVAPHLAGKMSIGKVDCTTEKALCKRFGVKGYPTMKYHRDGDFQDYPLGRDADAIM